MTNNIFLNFFALFFCVFGVYSDENGPYRGKYLGKLNSYHHQVGGEVYAVDAYTLLIVDFSYDGNGADTFFWAGAANRPGPQGFIVSDESGKTNVLERYFNKDITITLPDKKKLTDIKWFAIYDLSSQNPFGDVYIPEDFEPPALQTISELRSLSRGVKSAAVEIIDSKTIRIPQFSYDGSAKQAFFWVGVGPQPGSKGSKVPDEYGYMDPIRKYDAKDIVLELPGDLTIFEIDWLAVYDPSISENCGWVIIPDGLNVPPSLVKIVPQKNALPNCYQLHKDMQVSWEIFGPQITIQLSGQIGEDDYMAFGISGSTEKSQMLHSDVSIAYIDTYRGFATDYNITAFSPCARVLGQYKGVCRDKLVGGLDSNQVSTFSREDGINTVTYRRTLISSDNGDKVYPTDAPVYVVWAMGHLDKNKEPAFHDFYPKSDIKLELGRKDESNCFSFTRSDVQIQEPWEKMEIFDRTIRTFTATIGPSGGKKGYQGITGRTSSGLAWYVNGLLAPDLWLRRGQTYAFMVRGGNNPHSAETYHPLIITTEPHGGLEQLSEAAQKQIRVLAGVEYTRRGQPRPTAAGALCIARHDDKRDRRLDDDFPNFKSFNRSLIHTCDKGDAAILEVMPNSSWPDIVYYNSFTHSNMGWKIHILDNYNNVRDSSTNVHSMALLYLLPVVITLKTFW